MFSPNQNITVRVQYSLEKRGTTTRGTEYKNWFHHWYRFVDVGNFKLITSIIQSNNENGIFTTSAISS